MKRIDARIIQKILFITLSNIGDAILTTPSLDLIRRFFPKSKITVMVGPRAREVFEGHPEADQVLLYNKHSSFREKIFLMMKLKKEHFDLVIDLRHTLIPLFIKPRFATPLFRKTKKGHAAIQHLDVLKSLGIEGHCTFVLPCFEGDCRKVKELMNQRGISSGEAYVVLAPGAASPLKRWDVWKFRELAKRLRDDFSIPIVIVGTKGDEPEFNGVFSKEEWVSLVGELSLMELGHLLKSARLFITNDSGPMHLAAAFGTPTLAIFGPTDPEVYGPYGPTHRVVRLDLHCSPCMKGFCRIKTHECLKTLEVNQVYQTLCEMLKGNNHFDKICIQS